MSDSINALSLVSLDEARAWLNLDSGDQRTNIVLSLIVKGVSARMESAMGRKILSRTWTHDASTLDRLDSHGGIRLWLRNTPVTAISVLKIDPDGSALTKGWDSDYEVDSATGELLLRNGYVFWDRQKVVEITYVGGYLSDSGAGNTSEPWVWGYDDRSSDIRLAAMQQTKFEYDKWRHEEDGVLTRSEEGVSVTYPQGEFLPRVQSVVDRYRFDPSPVGAGVGY